MKNKLEEAVEELKQEIGGWRSIGDHNKAKGMERALDILNDHLQGGAWVDISVCNSYEFRCDNCMAEDVCNHSGDFENCPAYVVDIEDKEEAK